MFSFCSQYATESIRTKRRKKTPSDLPAFSKKRVAGQLEPISERFDQWNEFKTFYIDQRVVEDENRSICSFYLKPMDGKPLPKFKPGQYLTFKLLINTSDNEQPKSVVRCYSLSDKPEEEHYRVTIKRVMPPPGHSEIPAGVASNYFHEHVMEGDKLLVKAPSGHFHLLEEDVLPVVLIAGGIGITPMLSILSSLLASGSKREIWLFYGVRNGREQVMKKFLQQLSAIHDSFHLHLSYSNPSENDRPGLDYQHHGRVDLSLLRNTLKLMRYQFYVCGPKAMMESIVPALEAWGVDSSDIYYESFGPASLEKHRSDKTSTDSDFSRKAEVTLSRTDTRMAWDSSCGSLLEFVESCGVEVDSGCRAGSCGCCQTALLSGKVEYSQQPDVEVPPGHCLLCVSTPMGDITLDL